MPFVLSQYQRYLELAGYKMRDVPTIERADVFTTKGGDRIVEHLLTLQQGNTEYALRPEFTAAAARAYSAAGGGVARWQFSGPVFEDYGGQGGRGFERRSIGIELLGMAGPVADSEVIGLAASGLQRQGITDFQIVVGHAGLTRALVARYTPDEQLAQFLLNQRATLSDPQQGRAVVEVKLKQFLNLRPVGNSHTGIAIENDGLSDLLASITLRTSTLGGRTREDVARRLLSKQRRAQDFTQLLRALDALEAWVSLAGAPSAVLPQVYQFAEDDAAFAAAAADLRTTLDLLEYYGIPADALILRPDLSRVWDYYSGVVFELRLLDGGSIGGGGRYDGLLRLLGNPVDAPAVGFQINADILSQRYNGQLPAQTSTLVLHASRSRAPEVIQWATALRALGVACEIGAQATTDLSRAVSIDDDGAEFAGRRYAFDQAVDLARDAQERMRS